MARRKRSKRGGGKGWTGFLLAFLLGVILAAVISVWLIQKRPPSRETFAHCVSLVDQAIHSQLREMGVARKDILLQRSPVKKEGGLVWDQSSMKIRIPRSLPFSVIEEQVRRCLSIPGKPFSIESSQTPESLKLEIKVQDRITHQLVFIRPETIDVSTLPERPPLKAAVRPKIAIVIDDLGGENHLSQELLDMRLPVTFSILPFTPFSRSLALEAHKRGKEIILHVPMEPRGYPQANPGEGVLLHQMDDAEMLLQLSRDIEAVPYAKGVSNHMGSRLMEEPEKLRIIFLELKKRGLFFLDSRTSPQTTGIHTAQSVGLKALGRSVFIDHSSSEGDIKERLDKLIQVSLSTGKAVGIGHPHPSTLKIIKETIPRMKEKGIEVVPLSAVMNSENSKPSHGSDQNPRIPNAKSQTNSKRRLNDRQG